MKSLKINRIEQEPLSDKKMQHIAGANTKGCVVAAVCMRVGAGLRPWTTGWPMPRQELGPGAISPVSKLYSSGHKA